MATTMTVGGLKAFLDESLEDGLQVVYAVKDTLAICDQEGPLAQLILADTDEGTFATIIFIDECSPGMAAYLALTADRVVNVVVDLDTGFTATKAADRKEMM